MTLPIRARITLWYVALLALVVAAVGAFLMVRLRADLTHAIDTTLSPAAVQIAAGYREEGVPEARDTARTVLTGERPAAQVLSPDGRVVATIGDRVARVPMLDRGAVRDVLAGRRIVRTAALGRRRARFRVAATAASHRATRAVIVAAESLQGVDRSGRRVLGLLLLAGPAALLLTAAGGWWLAGRALAPIERVRVQAQEIGVGRLHERIAIPATGDEVARLAVTLNTMLARIETGMEEQRRLIADTSHDLGTPLAVMRAEIDVSLRTDDLDPAARDVLVSARDEVDRMSRIVDDLLTLASADEGRLELVLEPADLGAVAARVVGALASLAAARDVALRLEATPAPALADSWRLGQALGNLVDNAIKHGPRGATVVVSTAIDGASAVVAVEDAGAPIPPELRERVFDRFFRLDRSRSRTTGGSGIGLAIVREIAHAHGGRAWVEPGAGGNRFAIALPARDSTSDAAVPAAPVQAASR